MNAIPKGSPVRQKVAPIEGTVAETRFDEGSSSLSYRVEYKDANGEPHSRWFTEAEVEQTGDAQPPADLKQQADEAEAKHKASREAGKAKR